MIRQKFSRLSGDSCIKEISDCEEQLKCLPVLYCNSRCDGYVLWNDLYQFFAFPTFTRPDNRLFLCLILLALHTKNFVPCRKLLFYVNATN